MSLACGLPGSLADTEPTSTPVPPPTGTPSSTPFPLVAMTPSVTLAPTRYETATATVTPLAVAGILPTATPAPLPPSPTPTRIRELSDEQLQALVGTMCPRREACFMYPLPDRPVSGTVEFKGAANRPGFSFYKLEYRPLDDPDWQLINIYEQSRRLGTLGVWNTTTVPNDTYLVRLVVVDRNGNYWAEEPTLRLRVENQPALYKDPFDGLRYNPTPQE